MANGRVLALGSTGLGGICLLRELLYREHQTIAYVRNPTKIPEDLVSSPLLEIMVGEIGDTDALSTAIAKSSTIVSLLGPNELQNHPPYGAWYLEIERLMREHGVRRILAVCAGSGHQPGDIFHPEASVLVQHVKSVYPELYISARAIEQAFEQGGQGLEWTVCRVGRLIGGNDELSWRENRMVETHVGHVGDKDWTIETGRGALAKWLVDCVEDGQGDWVRKMPAVST